MKLVNSFCQSTLSQFIKMDNFTWHDVAQASGLVIQKNAAGTLRLCQRMPLGGTSVFADVQLAVGDELDRVLEAISAAYGVSLQARSGQARSVGFRS